MSIKFTAALAAVMMMSSAAYAAQVGISDDKITVDISGSSTNGEIAAYILDEDEPIWADIGSFDGEYSFSGYIANDIKSGRYSYIVRTKDTVIESGDLTLTNAQDYRSLMQAVLNASDADEVKSAIESFDPALNMDIYDKIDKKIFAAYIFAQKQNIGDDIGEFNLLLKKLCALTAMRQNTDGIIKDNRLLYMQLLGAEESELSLYELLSDSGRSNVNANLPSKAYKDCEEACGIFKQLVYTNYITNSSVTIDEAKTFFINNASYLGISASNVSNDTIRALMKSKAATPEKLKEAYEKAAGTKDSSGGGGGGSSSGGSSSGSGSYVPVSAAENNKEAFSDLDGFDWAKNAIIALEGKGIVSGKGDGLFAPADSVKREEITAMAVRLFGYEASSDNTFSDVEPGSWYDAAISAACEKKIIYGISEEEFGVGMNVTRQDLAVIIFRAQRADSTPLDSDIDGVEVSDLDEIADYAKNAVLVLKKNGIISGYPDGSFAPNNNVTRAEAAVILYNAAKLRNSL